MLKSRPHLLKLCDLRVNLVQVFERDLFHVGACPAFVTVKRQKCSAVFNGKAERAGATDEGELM